MFSKCTSIAAIAIIFANATTAIPAKSSSESTDVDAAASTTQAGAASACTISDFSQVSGCLRSTQITVSNLQVPGGETLSLEKLQDGTTVTFSGTTTFGYKEWEGPLVSVSGNSVKVNGNGILDGQGAQYWDGKGSNGGKTKPKFFSAHNMDQGSISGITLKNMPVQGFSIQSDGITVDSVTIDNSAGTSKGHNTDAFDIGSSDGVTISNSNINNQDDCIAINSGTNINISGLTCNGGHGISVGSVGGRSDNTVANVAVKNCKVTNSQNGLRIKTVYDATGDVSNITWSDVQLSGITNYGIVIEQDYQNGSPTGTPTNGVSLKGVSANGVTGSVASGAKEVYVLCGTGCADFSFSGVDITGGSKGSVSGVTISGYS